jgi:RHS repeat-associated protein
VSNSAGNVVEKRLFDAWGNVIKVEDGNGLPVADGAWIIDRGYTGHEHLHSIGIIHMNGRLYDPKLHRFLQPDNYVQEPYNTQNYNRYGYVFNNPLKYTDPSGEYGEGPGNGGGNGGGTGPRIDLNPENNGFYQTFQNQKVQRWMANAASNVGKASESVGNFFENTGRFLNNLLDVKKHLVNFFKSQGSSLQQEVQPAPQQESSSWTGGGGSYINNVGSGFVDSINPVNWVKGLWNEAGDTSNSYQNIITGNGSGSDFLNIYSTAFPDFKAATGLYSLGKGILSGDGRATGSLLGQAAIGLVTKKFGGALLAKETMAAKTGGATTWNQFQKATVGQFSSRAEAGAAWSLYKNANGIVTGAARSQAQKSSFLIQAAESRMYPKWMNQWLRNGKVPPGYHVDHKIPLSIGGADVPANMRLLDIDFHINIHHKYYRPW